MIFYDQLGIVVLDNQLPHGQSISKSRRLDIFCLQKVVQVGVNFEIAKQGLV